MGTPLGPKCIPYTYMDPLGNKDNSLRTKPRGHCPSPAGGLLEHFLKAVNEERNE